MKKSILVALLIVIGLLLLNCYAQINPIIDISRADQGYYIVNYPEEHEAKMKIGITYDYNTIYYDYIPGTEFIGGFECGEGKYIISLYRCLYGNYYSLETYETIEVYFENEFVPFLISTSEISFAACDTLELTLAKLNLNEKEPIDKVRTFFKFIRINVAYDYRLAEEITKGTIDIYVPDIARTLETGKGICYDYAALFAAMCRSEGIPCYIMKGDYKGQYHAWNMAYINGAWRGIDLINLVHNVELNKGS